MNHLLVLVSNLALLTGAADSIPYKGPLGKREIAITSDIQEDLNKCMHSVPESLRVALLNWQDQNFKGGSKYFEGIVTSPEEASQLMCGLAMTLGHIPVGFSTERDGQLIHHLKPSKAERSEQTSRSCDVILETHQELAFMPRYNRPRFLILYGVQQDFHKEAGTGAFDFRDLELTSKEMELALQKGWYCGADTASLINGQVEDTQSFSHILGEQLPMLSYDENGSLTIEFFDADCGISASDELLELRERIKKQIETKMEWYQLKKGDVLIIDNDHAVHSRSSFRATFDEKTDRHLLRTLVSRKENKYFDASKWCVNFQLCTKAHCSCINACQPGLVSTLKSQPGEFIQCEANIKKEVEQDPNQDANNDEPRLKKLKC